LKLYSCEITHSLGPKKSTSPKYQVGLGRMLKWVGSGIRSSQVGPGCRSSWIMPSQVESTKIVGRLSRPKPKVEIQQSQPGPKVEPS